MKILLVIITAAMRVIEATQGESVECKVNLGSHLRDEGDQRAGTGIMAARRRVVGEDERIFEKKSMVIDVKHSWQAITRLLGKT